MKYQTKYNKFKSQTASYNGRTYHSKKEANYAFELDMRIKAKEIRSWEPQHKIEISINGIHITNYFIDFRVLMLDGTYEYHEVKGFSTDIWRLKWLMTQALYPEYKLVLIR